MDLYGVDGPDEATYLSWLNATGLYPIDKPARSLKVATRVRIPLGLQSKTRSNDINARSGSLLESVVHPFVLRGRTRDADKRWTYGTGATIPGSMRQRGEDSGIGTLATTSRTSGSFTHPRSKGSRLRSSSPPAADVGICAWEVDQISPMTDGCSIRRLLIGDPTTAPPGPGPAGPRPR
jgi:hypothetical protein